MVFLIHENSRKNKYIKILYLLKHENFRVGSQGNFGNDILIFKMD